MTALVVAGGGTGGHVFPALAVASVLREEPDVSSITFFGTARGLEARLAPSHGFPLELVRARGLIGKSLVDRARALADLVIGLIQAFRSLGRLRPRAVLGVGGYASAPVVLAAALRRIPTVLHEQNAVAGWTNRLLAPLARVVAVSFPETRLRSKRVVVTGNPTRDTFFRIEPPQPSPGRLRILVVGGSQGSRLLNRHVPAAFGHSLLADHELDVVHQSGPRELEETLARYRAIERDRFRFEVLPFVDDLATRYAWCDLALARAGAATVFELAAAGRAAILVPFAAAASAHQDANARALETAGAAIVVPESEASPDRIAQELAPFAYDPPKIVRFGAAAKTLARPDAARAVARLVLAAAGLGEATA